MAGHTGYTEFRETDDVDHFIEQVCMHFLSAKIIFFNLKKILVIFICRVSLYSISVYAGKYKLEGKDKYDDVVTVGISRIKSSGDMRQSSNKMH